MTCTGVPGAIPRQQGRGRRESPPSGAVRPDLAGGEVEGREQAGRTVPPVVLCPDMARLHRQGLLSLARALGSATGRTTAGSAGSTERPTTSRTLSSNRGSRDTLKVLAGCGLRPCTFRMACTPSPASRPAPAPEHVPAAVTSPGRSRGDQGLHLFLGDQLLPRRTGHVPEQPVDAFGEEADPPRRQVPGRCGCFRGLCGLLTMSSRRAREASESVISCRVDRLPIGLPPL